MGKIRRFSKEKKIHILIVDEKYPREQRREIAADQVFVLTRERGKDFSEPEQSIYKYQCADQILAEVFETYFERTNENVLRVVKKKHQKMIAVYSPIHRAGKTTFSIALGRELTKKEQTLYLNLEEYPGFGGRFEREESKNLGDVLYYAKQENSNLGIRLNTMIRQMDGLDYIPPIPVCCDLKEITAKEWELLFREIMDNSVYETIILDLGESIQGLFQMLYMCDRIYMPVLEDEISQEKLTQYEDNLNRLGMEELREKTIQFMLGEEVENEVRNLVREEW